MSSTYDTFHEILDDQLWLGPAFPAVHAPEQLRLKGITHVLNVTQEHQCPHTDLFTYMHIQVDDDERENLIEHWPKTKDFIQECIDKNGKIYVHCAAGISRSASTVIAYLIAAQKMTLLDAFQHVFNKRRIIQPNVGFFVQLQKLEKEVHGFEKSTFPLENYVVFRVFRLLKPKLDLRVFNQICSEFSIDTDFLMSALQEGSHSQFVLPLLPPPKLEQKQETQTKLHQKLQKMLSRKREVSPKEEEEEEEGKEDKKKEEGGLKEKPKEAGEIKREEAESRASAEETEKAERDGKKEQEADPQKKVKEVETAIAPNTEMAASSEANTV